MNSQTCVNQQSTNTRSEYDRTVEIEPLYTTTNARICGDKKMLDEGEGEKKTK
jgi:hypothetical protein